MGLDIGAIVHNVIMGLSDHVFGSVELTTVFLMMFLVVFSLLVRIPAPFAFVVPLPLAITFAAYGYMSVLFAGILSMAFVVIAVVSFLTGMGTR